MKLCNCIVQTYVDLGYFYMRFGEVAGDSVKVGFLLNNRHVDITYEDATFQR